MKKMLVFSMLMFCAGLMAQPDPETYPQPGSIFDIFADLKYWLSSTATVAGLTIFLTLIVSNLWATITAIWKQIVALVIAMLLMAVGNLINVGFMADFNIVSTIVYGLVVGFMSNGLYDLKNITR